MKNILINYLGRSNSGPTFTIEVTKALVNQGYNVYVIISKYISNYSDWHHIGLRHIYEIDTYKSKNDYIIKTISFFLKDLKRIKGFYKNIDSLILINPFFHVWSNMITRIFSKNRIITYCHDPIVHSGVGIIEKLIQKNFIKKSTDIIVLSKCFIPVIESAYAFPKEKIYYSQHGLLKSYSEKYKDYIYKNHQYNENKINFFFFGRIQKYKGLHLLAEAYKIICGKYENVTLSIIGSGNFSLYENKYKDLKNFKLINGYIKDEEIGNYFVGKNLVCILPYTDATQSGVIPIAMEFGVPVIASHTGGLYEQLFNGEVGIFFKPNDSFDLFKKMELFILNPDLFIEQKKMINEKIKMLDWDYIIKKLIKELKL